MSKITSNSRLFNLTVATVATLPLAAAVVFTSAGSAQASSFNGEFQFQGGSTLDPFASSQVSLSQNSLSFTPQPITPVGLGLRTGSFTPFNTANIGNIISFVPNAADIPFLDLGNLAVPGIIQPADNTSSLTDGLNIFTLTNASYNLAQSGANVAIDVPVFGFFTNPLGEISQGAGNLTFQVNNSTLAQVTSTLASGGSLSNLSFSGGFFATVPEPATVLGLGLVGVGMTMSRRRKGMFQ